MGIMGWDKGREPIKGVVWIGIGKLNIDLHGLQV